VARDRRQGEGEHGGESGTHQSAQARPISFSGTQPR
jgi:hypothetical protein